MCTGHSGSPKKKLKNSGPSIKGVPLGPGEASCLIEVTPSTIAVTATHSTKPNTDQY